MCKIKQNSKYKYKTWISPAYKKISHYIQEEIERSPDVNWFIMTIIESTINLPVPHWVWRRWQSWLRTVFHTSVRTCHRTRSQSRVVLLSFTLDSYSDAGLCVGEQSSPRVIISPVSCWAANSHISFGSPFPFFTYIYFFTFFLCVFFFPPPVPTWLPLPLLPCFSLS